MRYAPYVKSVRDFEERKPSTGPWWLREIESVTGNDPKLLGCLAGVALVGFAGYKLGVLRFFGNYLWLGLLALGVLMIIGAISSGGASGPSNVEDSEALERLESQGFEKRIRQEYAATPCGSCGEIEFALLEFGETGRCIKVACTTCRESTYWPATSETRQALCLYSEEGWQLSGVVAICALDYEVILEDGELT